ncbi:nucleotide-binding universal stress UspA family protein [Saonia flava]|uniref:Nucleotide-binding universal stress UspA family protein n=1 Tax=Saonia flava TaxID=523696 RepID=A0A846QZS5_9FLAO|nr:universal stress protein [Saonia flava]NJB72172.1 nucleotide-binding universal stress UspA family protein [Saonia flava]
MKHILLPTDFSPNAWNAIFTALKLYANISCKFYLLHTYEPKTKNLVGQRSSTRSGIIYDSMDKESKGELEEVLGYINENHSNPNHSFEVISIQNDLARTIKDFVHEKDLDMIVMGTKGATGAKKIFMGSNTVKVIKTVDNCPIIAIPDSFNFQSLKTIVLPSDYTYFFDKNSFSELIELVKLWQSKILIFHVAQEFNLTEEQEVNKKILKERLKDLNYSFHKVTLKSTVTKEIINYSKENNADMVVLVHSKHTFMEKLNQEPVISKIGFTSTAPLLVLPGIN